MLLHPGAVPVLCHSGTATTAEGDSGEAFLGNRFQQAHGNCCVQSLQKTEVQEREELWLLLGGVGWGGAGQKH